VNTIYVWYENGGGEFKGDITIYAIDSDGSLLLRHRSSGVQFYEHDAGFTSYYSHHRYNSRFPNGDWYLKNIEDPEKSKDKVFMSAYAVFKRNEGRQ